MTSRLGKQVIRLRTYKLHWFVVISGSCGVLGVEMRCIAKFLGIEDLEMRNLEKMFDSSMETSS